MDQITQDAKDRISTDLESNGTQTQDDIDEIYQEPNKNAAKPKMWGMQVALEKPILSNDKIKKKKIDIFNDIFNKDPKRLNRR